MVKVSELDPINEAADLDLLYLVDTSVGESGSVQITSQNFRKLPIYADSTARDAAITAPASGQLAILSSPQSLTMYENDAWATVSSSSSSSALEPTGGDDTSSIQNAINALSGGGILTLASGIFTINEISLIDDVYLNLTPGCYLYAGSSYTGSENMIRITNIDNAGIIGNGCLIDMGGQHTSGEHNAGLYVGNVNNILIDNVRVQECGGDGITITGYAKNVTVKNSVFDKNRRQGASIVGAEGVTFDNCKFTNTGRGLAGYTSPGAGIDVEPLESRECRDVNIVNCVMENNEGAGIAVNIYGFDTHRRFTLNIANNVICNNFNFGINIFNSAENRTGGGLISISDCSINNSGGASIIVNDWSEDVPIIISNVYSRNPNIINTDGTQYKTHMSVYRSSGSSYTFDIGRIKIVDCIVDDYRLLSDVGHFSFTNATGSTAPVPGDRFVDGTTSASGILAQVEYHGGTWAGSSGIMHVADPYGAVNFGETITTDNGATVLASGVTNAKPPFYGVIAWNAAGAGQIKDVEVDNLRCYWAEPTYNSRPVRIVRNFADAHIICNVANSGDPEGQLNASVGSTYRRLHGGIGTTFYVKESGDAAEGWYAK